MCRYRAFVVFCFAVIATFPGQAAIQLHGDDVREALIRGAAAGERFTIDNVRLAPSEKVSLELQPMQVWAADARVVVHHAGGETEEIPPPAIRSFRGSIAGDTDSLVYISLLPDGEVQGLITRSERQFRLALARPVRGLRERLTIDERPLLGVREVELIDDLNEGDATWTCEAHQTQETAVRQGGLGMKDHPRHREIRSDAASVSGASYHLRLAIETDGELYAAFGSSGALTTYLTNLVGAVSAIYQRDIATTLTIGHTNIYAGGAASDPWTSGSDPAAMLAQLGTYYATNNTANYGQVQRSTVVMVSGRGTNGGIAWFNTLCSDNFFCGPTGADCGSSAFANAYAGGYAFCGSLTSGITTTLPNTNQTINGIQYAMPNTNNFWMLAQFAHELGHNVGSPHTHCVSLSAQDKITYGVTRNYVDECAGESGCFAGTNTFPAEYGTIMSYCHNLNPGGGARASRYLMGKSGEASEKMLPIFKGDNTSGLEGATPNPTISSGIAPIPCSGGQSASVPSCGGCTYSWQITGGTITSSTTTSSITYTPNAASVTLTVTVTNAKGCGITASRTTAASCVPGGAPAAPTNVVATATGPTSVTVSWTASAGATAYQVYRCAAPGPSSCTAAGASVAVSPATDTGAAAGTSYLYIVQAINLSGTSPSSAADLATTVIFTDPALVAGSTTAKLAHFNELRTAVNAVRALAGMGAFNFSQPLPAASVTIRKAHIDDLRSNVTAARSALGLASNFAETLVAGATTIKASHINELRGAVQ